MNDIAVVLPRPWPVHQVREGAHIRLEPLVEADHAAALFECGHGGAAEARLWDYMGYGPFVDAQVWQNWVRQAAAMPDPQFYAIVNQRTGLAAGVCSLLRIEPAQGVIEVGHIWYAPALQRTVGATEAMFLLFAHVFDGLGYRRLEWKCNALNGKSRQAALRLGFTFEGVFRQHMMVKGRNRDSAWFSLLDHEWPRVRAGMQAWLDTDNFVDGQQLRSLATCMTRLDA